MYEELIFKWNPGLKPDQPGQISLLSCGWPKSDCHQQRVEVIALNHDEL